MRQWLRWVWALFKWSMVLLGGLVVWFTVAGENASSEEFLVAGDTGCDFSFELPKGEWIADPNAATYTNKPVMVRKSEMSNPKLLISVDRFWRNDKSPGGWLTVNKKKCQLASRDVVQTRDGKAARVFLASSCEVGEAKHGGRIKSPFQEHSLFGYVLYNEKDVYLLYLSSSDQALLRQNEDVLLSALKSYSTGSRACVAKRTTVKKLEIAQ